MRVACISLSDLGLCRPSSVLHHPIFSMKPLFLSFLVCGSVTAFAQTTPSAGKSDSAPPVADKPAVSAAGIDETTRLEQEYMARRAEWVALRSEALERTKKAPEAGSRKQITRPAGRGRKAAPGENERGGPRVPRERETQTS